MIVDTSVLIAILKSEPEWRFFSQILHANTAYLPSPTALENFMVTKTSMGDEGLERLNLITELFEIKILDFTDRHLKQALSAFNQYGKGGGSRAKLNFGDCLVYGVAKAENMPLLFKGNDFLKTDIVSAS